MLCRLLGFFFNDVHSLVFLIWKTNRPNPQGYFHIAVLSVSECPQLGSTLPGRHHRERCCTAGCLTGSRTLSNCQTYPDVKCRRNEVEPGCLIWPDQCCPPCPWACSWDWIPEQVRNIAIKKKQNTPKPKKNNTFPFHKLIQPERALGMC